MKIQLLALVGGASLLLSVFGCKLDDGGGYNYCTSGSQLRNVFVGISKENYLSRLSITDKIISQIVPYAFNDLVNVTLLHLQFADYKILDLQPQSFNGLPNLQALIISSGVVALEQNLFTSVSKTLTTLSLRINGTNPKLSNGLSILINLEQLTIENTILNSIDDKTFKNLSTKINVLELNSNSLAVINQNAFVPLPNLRILTIHDNKLSDIDAGTFASLPKLISLSITKNNLNAIRKNTFINMDYMLFLNLASNKIKLIENYAFANLKLEKLVLRDNQVRYLEENSFKNLTADELDLTYNELNCIRYNFFSTKIRHLKLSKIIQTRCSDKYSPLELAKTTITYV